MDARRSRAAAMTAAAAAVDMGFLASACEGSPESTEGVRPESAAPANAAPGRVVGTLESSASLKNNARTLVELIGSRELEAVVIGKVATVAYEGDVTRLEVAVGETLHGRVGSKVVVREDGGYLPAAQIATETREKFPDSGASAAPDEWVDVPFEGAEHLAPEDEVLLFLSKDPNPGREGEFQEVGSVYGRFDKAADGAWVRAGEDPTKQLRVSLTEVRRALTPTH